MKVSAATLIARELNDLADRRNKLEQEIKELDIQHDAVKRVLQKVMNNTGQDSEPTEIGAYIESPVRKATAASAVDPTDNEQSAQLCNRLHPQKAATAPAKPAMPPKWRTRVPKLTVSQAITQYVELHQPCKRDQIINAVSGMNLETSTKNKRGLVRRTLYRMLKQKRLSQNKNGILAKPG